MIKLHGARLSALRAKLASLGLDGFLVPRADEHLGEYVPASAERLAFISGFTGSAGLAIILPDKAAVFSDGRYTLQLQTETDANLWEQLHLTEQPPEDWLKANAADLSIGYDPMLVSPDFLARFSESKMVPLQPNPIDSLWADRPALPMAPAVPYDIAYAGRSSAEKRQELAQLLLKAGQDAAILTDPASLAWLFNIRGTDLEFTPVALGFALVNADASATIFMPPTKLPPETIAQLGTAITLADQHALTAALQALTGKTIRYDSATMPVWFKTTLEAAGAKITQAPDPTALARACKNTVEQTGSRAAHLRDGAAMARFLAWLAEAAPRGHETEMSAAAKLLAFRAMGDKFKGESFPAISGAGEHGAIIHYRVTPSSNRPLNPHEVYLIDSGGQYLDGTTDITRTIWTGPGPAPQAIKERYTRVLAGHIALAEAVFPEGVAGPHLDALARGSLWQAGLDYDHGTGHGVGSYLSVHEGPASISRTAKPVPLQAGMILSNEPGYYLPGSYGIRLENLILVKNAPFSDSTRKFLRFETLTLVPFDHALIDPALLAPGAINWLNSYHAEVHQRLAAQLNPTRDAQTLAWLSQATGPI
ncbi:MAG: aminopeptidase P family protein [Acidocella sp.]|nr:aminopeptidase P family protein [Acidocella sp.]